MAKRHYSADSARIPPLKARTYGRGLALLLRTFAIPISEPLGRALPLQLTALCGMTLPAAPSPLSASIQF